MSSISVTKGVMYTARLHGGEFDDTDLPVVAEGDQPNSILTMSGTDGAPVGYQWNGFLAEGCGIVSAGYSLGRGI